MSFSRLPYELQEAILAHQDKSDLASLCLVSKSFLEIARPLLYRTVKIVFLNAKTQDLVCRFFGEGARHSEEEEAEDDSEEEDRGRHFAKVLSRQGALLRTFSRHPEWKIHVKEVDIVTDYVPDQAVHELYSLLSSFVTLQRLELVGRGFAETLSSRTMDNLISSCPRSIRCLELAEVCLTPDDTYRFLQVFPELDTLTLPTDFSTVLAIPGNLDEQQSTTNCTLSLPRLKTLEIIHPNSSIINSVAAAAPSLEGLDIVYDALNLLTPSTFSAIRFLVISGDLDYWLISELVALFKGFTSLQSLKLSELQQYLPDERLTRALDRHQVLHHLPPTLQHLSLFSSHFDHSYLLDWMTSTTTTLKEMILVRFAVWS